MPNKSGSENKKKDTCADTMKCKLHRMDLPVNICFIKNVY